MLSQLQQLAAVTLISALEWRDRRCAESVLTLMTSPPSATLVEATLTAHAPRLQPRLTPERNERLSVWLKRAELSFQEAISPLEDELRRRYLRRLLKKEASIAAAARHAGVERANFTGIHQASTNLRECGMTIRHHSNRA